MNKKYYIKVAAVGGSGTVYYHICYTKRFLFFKKEERLSYNVLTKNQALAAVAELNQLSVDEQ